MAIGVINTGLDVIGGIGGIFGGGSREQKRQIRDRLLQELQSKGVKPLNVNSDNIEPLQILIGLTEKNQRVAVREINRLLPRTLLDQGDFAERDPRFIQIIQQIEQAIRGADTATQTGGGLEGGITPAITGGLQNISSNLPGLAIFAAAGFVIFRLLRG